MRGHVTCGRRSEAAETRESLVFLPGNTERRTLDRSTWRDSGSIVAVCFCLCHCCCCCCCCLSTSASAFLRRDSKRLPPCQRDALTDISSVRDKSVHLKTTTAGGSWRGAADRHTDRQAGRFSLLSRTLTGLVDLDPEPESRVEGGGQAGPTSGRGHGQLSRLRSSSLEIKEKEIREKGSEILREQLDAAKKELKLKDKECERLSQVRNQLEQELEELTASLFEEAHKMVREANVKQAAAEKQLKEAQGKIDVLQAEVTALKTLVLTSTPSSPNRQLHPQLQSSGTRGAYKHVGGHVRNKSASGGFPSSSGKPEPSPVSIQPKEDREPTAPALLSLILCLVPGHSVSVNYDPSWQQHREGLGTDSRQMDSVLFAEFLMWKEHPSLDRSSAFLSRIYSEDIGPCLSFTRSELSQLVQSAVENNSLTIEPVAMSALPMVKASAIECGGPNGFRAAIETKCALSGMSRLCRHRIKLGDKGSYYYISPSSRARITAVCNFFTYIRYIQQGLVRHDAEQMFWEVMRLRREMTVAKLGFYLTDQG